MIPSQDTDEPVFTGEDLSCVDDSLLDLEPEPSGRIHMRPFQWHLKTHWKYLMPLDTPITWNQKRTQHGEWWLDPQNVMQGEFLNPREHEKLIKNLQMPQTQVGTLI